MHSKAAKKKGSQAHAKSAKRASADRKSTTPAKAMVTTGATAAPYPRGGPSLLMLTDQEEPAPTGEADTSARAKLTARAEANQLRKMIKDIRAAVTASTAYQRAARILAHRAQQATPPTQLQKGTAAEIWVAAIEASLTVIREAAHITNAQALILLDNMLGNGAIIHHLTQAPPATAEEQQPAPSGDQTA